MVNSFAYTFTIDLYFDGCTFSGVIWSGDQAISGARETIEYLERAGTFTVPFITQQA